MTLAEQFTRHLFNVADAMLADELDAARELERELWERERTTVHQTAQAARDAHVGEVIDHYGGNMGRAARSLGVPPSTLYRWGFRKERKAG